MIPGFMVDDSASENGFGATFFLGKTFSDQPIGYLVKMLSRPALSDGLVAMRLTKVDRQLYSP